MARVNAGWLKAYEVRDFACLHGHEQPLQYGKIQSFVFQGEGKVTFKSGIGCVTRRVDAPAIALDHAVTRTNGRKVSGNGNREVAGVDKRRISHWSCRFGQPPFVKNIHRT